MLIMNRSTIKLTIDIYCYCHIALTTKLPPHISNKTRCIIFMGACSCVDEPTIVRSSFKQRSKNTATIKAKWNPHIYHAPSKSIAS